MPYICYLFTVGFLKHCTLDIIDLYCKDFGICVFPQKRVDFVIIYSFFTGWSPLTVYSWFYPVRKHFWKPRKNITKSLYLQRIQLFNSVSPWISSGLCFIVHFLKTIALFFLIQFCGYLWWEHYSKINRCIINRNRNQATHLWYVCYASLF